MGYVHQSGETAHKITLVKLLLWFNTNIPVCSSTFTLLKDTILDTNDSKLMRIITACKNDDTASAFSSRL